MKHLKPVVATLALAGGLGLASVAQAAPIGPAQLGASDARIERVADGCGPGYHANRWGDCRPNWGPRPYYARPAYGYGYGYGPPPPPPPPPPFYRPFYGPRPFF